MTSEDLSLDFIEESRRYLCQEYPAKIHAAVGRLSPGDLWWRPGPRSNSIGNLLLHLTGNVRQWVVHGLGGRSDKRNRSREFASEGGWSATELLGQMDGTLAAVDEVLSGLTWTQLAMNVEIQGLATTGFRALYHAVEHFSTHTGQILYIVKQRTDVDLAFYQLDSEGRVTGTQW